MVRQSAHLISSLCLYIIEKVRVRRRVLGASERVPVADALRAITLGAAYTLKMDHLVGSIEVGKFADFAVLEEDPSEVAPERLKDLQVWGTILGGRVFQGPAG